MVSVPPTKTAVPAATMCGLTDGTYMLRPLPGPLLFQAAPGPVPCVVVAPLILVSPCVWVRKLLRRYVAATYSFFLQIGESVHQFAIYSIMTHIIDPKHNRRELQVLAGTILGGSSIVKPNRGRNCYLSMRSKDTLWLKWKATELEKFASVDPFTEDKNGTMRWHSLCYPIFNDFRDDFYNDKDKILKLENIEGLVDIGLMTWWCDTGKIKDERAIFNTHIWGEEGSHVVSKYFELLDWESEVYRERKSFRVRLSKDSTKKLFSVIQPHMPHFMAVRANPTDIPKDGP